MPKKKGRELSIIKIRRLETTVKKFFFQSIWQREQNIVTSDPLFFEPKNTALIVIDAQQKLLNAIPNNKQIEWNIRRLIDATSILNVKVYLTEQNPTKLGSTADSIVKGKSYECFEKMDFSCFKCYGLIEDLKARGINNILLCGIESHVCILQSCLDLKLDGKNTFLITDAIGSRNYIDHDISLRRLERSGVILSTTETAIFELCKTASFQHFKHISSIIKEVMD